MHTWRDSRRDGASRVVVEPWGITVCPTEVILCNPSAEYPDEI